MTFSEVYEKWKKYASSRHKKQGYITILNNFDNHVLPYFKDMNIKELTKLDVMNWQNCILLKNFSNKYNSHIYYAFKSFIDYCVNCDYFKENIVSQVGPFRKKIEYKEHHVYNIWQFRWFRLHLDHKIIKEYFNFMYFYGTRPSEAMALRFSDLEGKYIHIRHSIHRKGKRELDTPKNQSSVRKIKLSLITRFRIWKLKQRYIKLYGCYNNYFIFGGKVPLSPTTIDRHKKNACDKARLYEITQHEFRHSYATRMINKNVSISYVSKTMGHSRISTTLDIYTH